MKYVIYKFGVKDCEMLVPVVFPDIIAHSQILEDIPEFVPVSAGSCFMDGPLLKVDKNNGSSSLGLHPEKFDAMILTHVLLLGYEPQNCTMEFAPHYKQKPKRPTPARKISKALRKPKVDAAKRLLPGEVRYHYRVPAGPGGPARYESMVCQTMRLCFLQIAHDIKTNAIHPMSIERQNEDIIWRWEEGAPLHAQVELKHMANENGVKIILS